MKKFLSLVLALVMTMSLVTIGASATEYKDLTDKSEIQYEEAVAVLNKLGIISGYEDGSFKPTGALTRGAAAKIIVSLMIGTEAASSLTVTAAPYKDVPTTNTFAAVISYCKTAGYINGYSDGTFRPTASLTGYAFAKMLLGALGYDGKVEGFAGNGWTMNVAKLGNKAGLFNDFKTAFKGNDGLTRESACLMALNTLKATEVEYTGNTINVSGDDVNVSVGNNQYSYVTSNNSKINRNIKDTKTDASFYTLEFGEEHFPDLKLASSASSDDFGRPANQWSLKNVTIGTYAKTADYSYTTKASGDTTTDKLKDMGIDGLKDTNAKVYTNSDSSSPIVLNSIPDQTAAGRLVEVYLSDTDADQIEKVIVIDTFVMQVKKVTSSGVTLKNPNENLAGSVNEVKSGDSCFKALSGLKVDDYVLVTVADGDVQSVAIPQSVSGKLTGFTTGTNTYLSKLVNTPLKNNVNKVTVAGTTYTMSFMSDSEDGKLSSSTKLTNTNNTTLYLDTYGNAIYAADVEAGTSYLVYDESFSSVVDGKIVTYAKGWDMDGKEVSLNMGTAGMPTIGGVAPQVGKVYAYKADTSNNAEYTWDAQTAVTMTTDAFIEGQSNIGGVYFDGSVKFVFIGGDNLGTGTADATGVTVKTGPQKVTAGTTSWYITESSKIKYVVVLGDNDVEASANVLYVKKADTYTTNASGKTVSVFNAYIDGELKEGLIASKNMGAIAGKFFTYSEADGVYTLHQYTSYLGKTTSVIDLDTWNVATLQSYIKNNAYLDKNFVTPVTATDLYAKNANVIDYSGDGYNITSLEDIANLPTSVMVNGVSTPTTIKLAFVYNDGTTSARGTVATIYVDDVTPAKA